MRKIFSILAVLILPAIVFGATNLWEYYRDRGESLPSLSERAVIYNANVGYDTYVGSFEQNQELLNALQQTPVGASLEIPTVVALFETTLVSKISSSATSLTLTSATDKNGNTLASSTYGFILDEGSANEEFVLCDCTGTACTNCTRGLSVTTGTTTVTALKHEHRRGASVKMTDAPLLLILTRIINGIGTFPNILSYTAHPTFSATTQIVDKSYVDNVGAGGFTAANVGTTYGLKALGTAPETVGINLDSLAGLTLTSSKLWVATSSDLIILSDGKVYVSTSTARTFTGATTFNTATTTFNAGVQIAATTPLPLKLNGVNYSMPSAQGTSTTVLMNDGNGTLYWDGTDKRVYTTVTPVTVVSSVSTTTLVTFTLPANFLGTQNILRIVLNVSAFRIDGIDRGIIFNFIYGATTQTTNVYAAGDTGTQSGDITFELIGAGATNSQKGEFHFSTQLKGISDAITTATGASVISTGTYAIDSTAAQTLTLQIQFTFSNANNKITVDNAYAYIIR